MMRDEIPACQLTYPRMNSWYQEYTPEPSVGGGLLTSWAKLLRMPKQAVSPKLHVIPLDPSRSGRDRLGIWILTI